MREFDLSDYPNTWRMLDATDATVIETREGFYVGSRGDEAAGLRSTQYTPELPSMDELEAYCSKHIEAVEAIPAGQPIPYLGDEDE